MIDIAPANKKLVLGTALWGWGVTREEAFALLENYLQSGGGIVDTATNYPINKCKDDFGLAIKWLGEWKALHPRAKLALIAKIGSKDNMGGPETDLSHDSIIESYARLRDVFEDSLSCVSIHWDNRLGSHEQAGIDQTVAAMSRIRESGLDIGLSGIKSPLHYRLANPDLSGDWIIQVKENFLTDQARQSYEEHFPYARYLAYGINMGGVKSDALNKDSSVNLRGIEVESAFLERLQSILGSDHGIEPRPTTLNELSLAFAYGNASLAGVIIGPRNVKQLVDTIDYWKRLEHSAKSPAGQRYLNEMFR